MSLWKGTQSRGSRLQTLHGTETILSSSHCLSLLRPDPQVPASHIYTTNCEVRCMKRLNVKQCHLETTKTASASRHSTYVCVLWNHSKPVFFFFLKNARSKNDKLTRHLSLTYGDKFRTNMKNATINHIIYKNWINFIIICNQYVIKSIFKNATEQIFSPDTCSFLWKSCLRSKLRSIR